MEEGEAGRRGKGKTAAADLVLALEAEKESMLPVPPVLAGLLSAGASSRGMYSARMDRTEGGREGGRGDEVTRAGGSKYNKGAEYRLTMS